MHPAPPPLPQPDQSVDGYEADPGKIATARLLATALGSLAMVSLLPAGYELFDHLRWETSPGIARWAYIVLWIGLVQVAYAVYLVQLPDWSSVQVVTGATLLLATFYAMLLGLTFLARGGSPLVAFLELQPQVESGLATGWCFIMLCLASLFSYASGRVSSGWQKTLAGR